MTKGDKFRKAFEEVNVADYEGLLGLLKFRRSIRGFKDAPVPDELIDKILEAARWSPSAANSQPWDFVVVKEKETIEKLAEMFEFQRVEKRWLEATRDKKEQMYPGARFPALDKQGIVARFKADLEGKSPFRAASHIILPLADERWCHAFPLRTHIDKGRQHIIGSMASAVLAMHLAAASLGLASQWLSDFGSPWLEGVTRNFLRIPQYFHIYEPLAVGWPAYYPKPRHVKPLEEFVHRETYDPAKSRTEEEIGEYIDAHLRSGVKRKR